MINFGYTILYVKDVIKSIEFYENAFGIKRKFITPENDYAELLTGETTLSFAIHKLAKSNLTNEIQESNIKDKAFGFEIAFTTDDVEKVLKDSIEAGAILEANPKTKPWGQTVAYIRDLDGFLVEICTPMN